MDFRNPFLRVFLQKLGTLENNLLLDWRSLRYDTRACWKRNAVPP